MKKCKFCAEQIQDEAIVCRHCGNNLTKATEATTPTKPARAVDWKKIGIVALVALVAIITIGVMANNSGVQNQSSPPAVVSAPSVIRQPATTTAPASTSTIQAVAPTPKVIQYEVVSRWSFSGGGGEDIVIPTSYLNQTDMTALGEKLKSDLQNNTDANVAVYTDKKAAAMKNEVDNTDTTKAELDFYDSHHVAAYTKNANTGYHTYMFGLNGLGGANDTVINY